MNLSKLVQGKKLTEVEQNVLDYIMEHIDTVLSEGVRAIARKNYTSTSTIMRLSHKLGYSGYVDMCYKLRALMQGPEKQVEESTHLLTGFNLDTLMEYNHYDMLKKCAKLLAQQDDGFIFIYATGFSAIIGDYFANKLINMGRPCLFASGRDSSRFFENSLEKMSLFLCVSKSGETGLVRDKIKTAKENGIPTVAITGDRPNSVSEYADIWFRVLDVSKLDYDNVTPNIFFPLAMMLTELLAYEYHRLCLSQQNGTENG